MYPLMQMMNFMLQVTMVKMTFNDLPHAVGLSDIYGRHSGEESLKRAIESRGMRDTWVWAVMVDYSLEDWASGSEAYVHQQGKVRFNALRRNVFNEGKVIELKIYWITKDGDVFEQATGMRAIGGE